jgi:hypothetical protein
MKNLNELSRRKLLKLGVGGLVLPPLASLLGMPNFALADNATEVAGKASKPVRLVTVFFPNGVSLPPANNASYQDWHWFPHNTGTEYTMTKSLEPLAKHRSDLSILSGFSHPELRSVVPHSCATKWLTSTVPPKGSKNLMSFDQVFADTVEGATRFSSLCLSAAGGSGSPGRPSTLSVNRNGALIPSLSEPQQIFDRLFTVDSGGIEQRRRGIVRDRSLLDRVSAQLNPANVRVGSEDKAHLDAYLNATETLEKQLVRANEWLDVPKPDVDAGLFDFNSEPTRDLGTNYMRTMFDLIHMSLLTDSTRVVTYQTSMENAGGRGNQLPYAAGLSLHHHQLTHSAARDNGGWDNWARYDQYLAERFSEFLTKMADTPDPLAEGSLLDNTVVLYGCGTSKTHVGRNYPLIVAGGKNVGLKHGAFHKFEEERPFSDVLLTLLQQLGVETDSFGDSENIVSEILA